MDRPDETSGLSAAPSATPPEKTAAQSPGPGTTGFQATPPRPLPARSFHVAGFPDPAPLPDPAGMKPETPDAPAPLSADAAFSAIEAEASSRSLSAVETALADALREIVPHEPVKIPELSLPSPTVVANRDLGDTIPQRMFEPRFEAASVRAAFDSLHIDPVVSSEIPHTTGAAEPKLSRPFAAILKRALKIFAWIAIAWLALILALIVLYRFVNPPASMLMLQHWVTGESVVQKWVPFNQISPNVVRAVILSEDARFCQHAGVDIGAIEEAIENSDGRSRGGSTISMQVVKNLFLWPSKSYIRKAIELPLTYVMEFFWPKRRIIEIYLNIAQWGPGIFGVGAAADYHFHKTARQLSVRNAAQLAVSLPNPLVRKAGRPGPGVRRLANAIQVRMRLAPSRQFSCVLPRRSY